MGGRRRSAARTGSAQNFETNPSGLARALTDNASFFVRSHFPAPQIDLESWRLTVEAEDGSRSTFTRAQLGRMRQRRVAVTLECAGNGRAGFGEVAEGEVAWGPGAVATAVWSGVPLSDLLPERMGGAVTQVVAEGADSGALPGRDEPVPYLRALPIEKALEPDTILALRMNSRPIPPAHGFPARLVVPGWYGMASVKWVRTIRLLAGAPLATHFNTTKYVYVTPAGARPVTEMRVKSLVTHPRDGETVRAGEASVIRGKAWSGAGGIERVRVWVDGVEGEAAVVQRRGPRAWATWSFAWTPRRPGPVSIRSRATDEAGNEQPDAPFANRYQYGFNAVRTIGVTVSD